MNLIKWRSLIVPACLLGASVLAPSLASAQQGVVPFPDELVALICERHPEVPQCNLPPDPSDACAPHCPPTTAAHDLVQVSPDKPRMQASTTRTEFVMEGIEDITLSVRVEKDREPEIRISRGVVFAPGGVQAFTALSDSDGPLTDCIEEQGCADKPSEAGVGVCVAACAVIVLEDCIFEDCDFDDNDDP